MTSLDAETISLWHLRGKVVAVVFLSTDCGHCQQAMQTLNPIYAEYKPRGLEIIAVAVNPTAADNLREFRAKYQVQFPLALGSRSDWSRLGGFPFRARPPYVPHILFVDRAGSVQQGYSGEDREFQTDLAGTFRGAVERLLKE